MRAIYNAVQYRVVSFRGDIVELDISGDNDPNNPTLKVSADNEGLILNPTKDQLRNAVNNPNNEHIIRDIFEDESYKDGINEALVKMRELGILYVQYEYSGCGDEGLLNDTDYTIDAEVGSKRRDRAVEYINDVEEMFCDAFVPSGFGDGAGGSYTLEIDLEEGTVTRTGGYYEEELQSAGKIIYNGPPVPPRAE